MGASVTSGRRWRWRRWEELSEVERVDLYTRQSLYLILWSFVVFVLVSGTSESASSTGTAVALGGALVTTVLGTRAMRAVFALHPATGPLPRAELVPFLLVAAVYLAAGVAFEDGIQGAVVMVVFANVAWAVGGVPDNRVSAAITVFGAALFGLSVGNPLAAAAGAGVAVFFLFTVRASLWLLDVVTELDQARNAQSALAVAEERLRFSRDVHDVMGRRLSTIAVQSELAATLAERGDERAAARMLEVRGVAHEALREARELARGYRATDLAQELEGARSLLRSAGIEVHLAVDDVPRGWHEAAGWVVREAVTNVLRHSTARSVSLTFESEELRVHNDGVAVGSAGSATGTGLQGIRERLAPLGARLEAGSDGEHGWTVTASLPGSGPLSSRRASQVGA
ncbi:sensor histidine kinase [Nocardioides nanhaiensis]|uniref:Histidine kinase n=1 Tax=Nocardioides nanhaiensis TaxID=1476871 RepID=A0ABP8VQF5_9ACTN